MRNYYIFKSGRIRRKDNSIMFEYTEEDIKKRVPIPVNDIDCMFLFGEIDLNTKLINFFSQNNIMIHFFNYYGFYTGSFYPKEFLNAGKIIVEQSSHYLNHSKRLFLAKEFIKSASHGTVNNLKLKKENLSLEIEKIKNLEDSIDLIPNGKKGISRLMGIEGNIKQIYYKSFQTLIHQKIDFEKRVKNPPDNMINALISFINSLVYTEVLKEIYKTQLNPTVSFLHEPGYRRFSLSLDIAEIFKPIYGDRLLFSLLNNNQLNKSHFDRDLNYAYLKENGRKIVVQAFDEKLKKTIYHKELKKKVSYQKIIRLELYKLVKHFLGEKDYKSFKIWW